MMIHHDAFDSHTAIEADQPIAPVVAQVPENDAVGGIADTDHAVENITVAGTDGAFKDKF